MKGDRKMKKITRLFGILFLIIIFIISLCACAQNEMPVESIPVEDIEEEPEESPEVSTKVTTEVVIKEQAENIERASAINPEVVGWFYIPGLNLNEPIVQRPGDNRYFYDRADWQGNPIPAYEFISDNHSVFTHYKNTFGSAEELSINTVLFGNSSRGYGVAEQYVGDEPTHGKFSQLFNFKDEEFAKMTPYIYFSTAKEDMVWEVFAVSYTDNGTWYIQQKDNSPQTFMSTVKQMREHSLYNYATEVTENDKVLTLSTATAAAGPNSVDWVYRFVIMAKLVEKADATKLEAEFELNENTVYPAGFSYHDYSEVRAEYGLAPFDNPTCKGYYKNVYLPLYEEKLKEIAEGKTLLDDLPVPEE